MPQDSGSAVLSLLGGILLFSLVLFLAWLCTRWLGKRYSFSKQGDKIRILEQKMIGSDRMLLIVRVGKRVWLLGAAGQNIVPIVELDPGQFPEGVEDNAGTAGMSRPGGKDFMRVLQESLRGHAQRKKRTEEQQDE